MKTLEITVQSSHPHLTDLMRDNMEWAYGQTLIVHFGGESEAVAAYEAFSAVTEKHGGTPFADEASSEDEAAYDAWESAEIEAFKAAETALDYYGDEAPRIGDETYFEVSVHG